MKSTQTELKLTVLIYNDTFHIDEIRIDRNGNNDETNKK